MPTARWVLPTPGGPRSRTLSVSAMNRQVARSLMTLGAIEGWNLKSKLSRLFWNGKRAMAVFMAGWGSWVGGVSPVRAPPREVPVGGGLFLCALGGEGRPLAGGGRGGG